MKKTNKKINFLATGASLLGALLFSIPSLLLLIFLPDLAVLKILLSGIFLGSIFLGATAGIHLALGKKVKRARLWWVYVIAVVLLLNILGSVGSLAFMFSPTIVSTESYADIALLLDCSGSMSSIKDARSATSAEFIEALNENYRLAIIPFGSTIHQSGTTGLNPMTPDNKQTYVSIIGGLLSTGGTDYGEPLELAYSMLTSDTREGAKRSVVILSDAGNSIPDNVRRLYASSDINVYSLRLTENPGTTSANAKQFIDFAKETGGFDIALKLSGGSVRTSDMSKAFKKVFAASSTFVPGLNGKLLLACNAEPGFFAVLIRILVLTLASVLMGVGHFAQFKPLYLLPNAALGFLTALSVSLVEWIFFSHEKLSGGGILLCCIPVTVLLASALVIVEYAPEKEDGVISV